MSLYLFLPLVACALGVVLAFVILLHRPRTPARSAFAHLLIFGALWDFAIFGMRASPDLAHALAWEKAALVMISFTSVSLYRFALFYARAKPTKAYSVLIYLFPILVMALVPGNLIVAGMQLKPYGYAPIPGPLFVVVAMAFYLVGLIALKYFIQVRKASTSHPERNRASYIIIGLSCSLLGGVADVLPLAGLPLYPGSIIGNIIFALITTLAILRYRLLDIHIAIRKTTAYAIVTAMGMGLYILLLLLVHFALTQTWRPPLWLSVAFIMLIAIGLQPVLHRVQNLVDRWFYRERYDYLQALERLGEETRGVPNLGFIASSLLNTVTGAMRCQKACLLLPDASGQYLTPLALHDMEELGSLSLEQKSALIQWLSRHEGYLTRKDLDIIPQLQALTYKERKALDRMEAELFLPLKTREGLRGVLILGRKLSGQDYSPEEVRMLRVATRQVAASLDNARLLAQLEQSLVELKQAQERLIQAERMRALGELANRVAHDFNNVLASILGRTELALEKVQEEKLKKDLEVVHEAARDGAQIVRKLRDFTRGEVREHFKPVRVNELVESTLQLVEHRLARQEQEATPIKVQLFLDRVAPISGDEGELKEVLTNLVINALDAMPNGGTLTIETRQENEEVIISIADTGVGMTPEVKRRIFEPYFSTKGSSGTGLGLSVVYGIIGRHRGRIKVESAPGKGSTFRVILPSLSPAGVEHGVPASGSKNEAVTRRKAKNKVLVIEDDPVLGEMMQTMLGQADFQAELAAGGREGLESFKRSEHELVLTDLSLPDISGREVAREIKRLSPQTPVILITGQGIPNPQHLKKDGIDAFLLKPFRKDELIHQVEQLLTNRKPAS